MTYYSLKTRDSYEEALTKLIKIWANSTVQQTGRVVLSLRTGKMKGQQKFLLQITTKKICEAFVKEKNKVQLLL